VCGLAPPISKVSHASRFGLILAVMGVLSSCGKSQGTTQNPPTSNNLVPVVKVERKDLTSTLEIASEFQPYQEIDVYAKVSGYIQKLNINWGAHVRKGRNLAVLEIPELEQQIHYDEAALRRSENELARAQEDRARMQSTYAVAHVTYTRLEGVSQTQPGLISQEDLDVAQGKDQEASAMVSAAKAALAAAEQALAAAKATLEKDRALYAYSQIIAPFDGVVTQLNAYTGALLPAGTSSSNGNLSLCHLSQNNLLRLVIPVPERSIPDIHLGDLIPVEVTTINKTFEGKVVRFSGQIDLSTRTMHTEIDVPNPQYVLVPGMYASVKLPLHTAHQVLAIPDQAVLSSSEERGSVMVVKKDDTLDRRDVTLGLRTPTAVEIVSGLEENEMVVFGEQSQYKPGEHVTPKIVHPPQAD
jgi:RND family efflux transporter MFP subunit